MNRVSFTHMWDEGFLLLRQGSNGRYIQKVNIKKTKEMYRYGQFKKIKLGFCMLFSTYYLYGYV